MPWKVRRNLSRQKTPMHNFWPCSESRFLTLLQKRLRGKVNKISLSPPPLQEARGRESVRQGVIPSDRNLMQKSLKSQQKRSESRDESGGAYKDFSENHETSNGIHAGTDQIPGTQCPASE